MKKLKEFCKHGHRLDAQNTQIHKGNRRCIPCNRDRCREFRRKRSLGAPTLAVWKTDLDAYNHEARKRFHASYLVDDVSGCWLWTAGTVTNGYGTFTYLAQSVPAHRAAYFFIVGEVPSGLQLDHLCRVRRCVNPAHLEPVTARVNVLRSESPSAINAAKTHCPRGHELSSDNAYPCHARIGRRSCKECFRIRARDYYQRKKGRGPKGDATTPGPSIEPQEVQP